MKKEEGSCISSWFNLLSHCVDGWRDRVGVILTEEIAKNDLDSEQSVRQGDKSETES